MNHLSPIAHRLAGEPLPHLIRPELLSDLFHASVAADPDRTAIICGSDRLTYGELSAQAQHVADLLASRGIGAGQFVGLWLERSANTLVALLGILKSGAAYIPFDADAPSERVQNCLTDAGAVAMMVDETTAQLAQDFPLPLLKVGDRAARKGSAAVQATPQSLAYAIYTSGSTGKPKAVGITHANICQYLRAANHLYGLTADDVVFQGASVAFDLSLEEIFIPLMVGATLWVATRQTLAATDQLGAILTQAKITVLDTVPTLLTLLAQDVPSLRVIILGGEVCPPSLAERWCRPGRRLFNSYGPTETTVVATMAEIVAGQPVTIGTPIPNSVCYVVDDAMQTVAPGTEGELLIGGPGVAPGYLGRPDLTSQKFIANPFADANTAPILYRTGDAVLVDEAGRLVFKGRIDDQVKVRGFRIELGEIEARLAALPAVAQAAVVVRRQDETDYLAAFLTINPGHDLDVAALRSTLLEQMPAYMVPSRFEPIDTLPRLISGKVDRKALMALPLAAGDAPTCEQPASETEAILLTAAKKVFPGQPIGFADDFFLTLGGHSLVAAHFVSQVRATPTLAHITLQDIYAGRTLRTIARTLDQGMADRPKSKVSQSFTPPPALRRFLCSAAQALVLPVILGLATAPWLGVFVSYMLLSGDDADFLTEVVYLLSTYSVVSLTTIFMAISAKWLVLGRTKPGRYPLWGAYYFRWWLAQRFLGLVHIKWFQDSPIIRVYLRLLGAKVGAGAIIGEVESGAFDLVSIGTNCTIGGRVRMATAEVIGNELVIGSIAIGDEASIGTSSVIGRDCVIGDQAELDTLTSLPAGTKVGPAEAWHGSPARRQGMVDLSQRPQPATASALRQTILGFAHGIALILLPPLTLIPIFPAFHLMDRLTDWAGADYLYYLPLAAWPTAMCLIFVTVALIVMIRWTILPSVKAGTYSVYSNFYFRKWVVALCTELTLDTLSSLYATVYMRFWYRLMGTKIGSDAEISTNLSGRYDLTEIGPKCFIADEVMLGEEDCQLGWITLEPVRLGARVFVGNDAVVPAGADIPSDTLIGIKSATPTNAQMNNAPSIWFGSPPMAFPVRQEFKDIGSNWTYEPPRWRRITRGVFEAFSVSFPTMLFITFGTYAVEALAPAILARDLARVIPQFFLASSLVSIALMLSAAIMKWLLMGVYRPTVKPMWSWWALRTEAIAVLYWGLAGKVILDHLRGSPFLTWGMRLFGAKIGKGVFMDTTDITEFDCVTVGDWCAINAGSALQTHLYEDRVMKVGRVHLGQGITIGGNATVLYDTQVGDFARIGPLSIIMKGESIPAHSSWHGAPAQTVTEAPPPPPAFITVENLTLPNPAPAYKQAS